MGDFHRNLETVELHAPGYIATTDPETTHGTGAVVGNFGVKAGQLWIEESSEDTPTALKYRNAANDGWVSLISDPIPALTAGDLLYADGSDSLATLGIGSARQVLQTNAGGTAPEWASNLDIPGTLDVTGAVTLDTGANGSSFGGDLDIGGDLVVSGTGPHAIGGAPLGITGLRITGAFTSDGSSTFAVGTRVDQDITGAAGDQGSLSLLGVGGVFGASITTQDNADTISIVSSVYFSEPAISKGATDTISAASTVYISDAPTEATNNYALWVDAGTTRLNGLLSVQGGVIAIAETTTPSAVAGEGRIYTKADNKLYFQDGAGTEHEIAFV